MGELMRGVTILSETQVLKLGVGPNKAFFIVFACTVVFLALAIVAENKNWVAGLEGLFWSFVIFGGCLAFVAFFLGCPKYYYNKYLF